LSAIQDDWLAMDALHGKNIKVRIFGFPSTNTSIHMRITDGTVALTTGMPVDSQSGEIEVKLMTPGVEPIQIALRFLKPVHPGGVGEEAIVIAGEHRGKLVRVKDTTDLLWELLILQCDSVVANEVVVVTAPQEYLVTIVKGIRTRRKLR
jgi:hypothetical protein